MVRSTNVYASNNIPWNIGDVWIDKFQNINRGDVLIDKLQKINREYILKFGEYYFNGFHYGFYFYHPLGCVPFNLDFKNEYNQGPK